MNMNSKNNWITSGLEIKNFTLIC